MINEPSIDSMIDYLSFLEKQKKNIEATELRNKLIKIQGIKVHTIEPPKNISKSDREKEYNLLKKEFDENFS